MSKHEYNGISQGTIGATGAINGAIQELRFGDGDPFVPKSRLEEAEKQLAIKQQQVSDAVADAADLRKKLADAERRLLAAGPAFTKMFVPRSHMEAAEAAIQRLRQERDTHRDNLRQFVARVRGLIVNEPEASPAALLHRDVFEILADVVVRLRHQAKHALQESAAMRRLLAEARDEAARKAAAAATQQPVATEAEVAQLRKDADFYRRCYFDLGDKMTATLQPLLKDEPEAGLLGYSWSDVAAKAIVRLRDEIAGLESDLDDCTRKVDVEEAAEMLAGAVARRICQIDGGPEANDLARIHMQVSSPNDALNQLYCDVLAVVGEEINWEMRRDADDADGDDADGDPVVQASPDAEAPACCGDAADCDQPCDSAPAAARVQQPRTPSEEMANQLANTTLAYAEFLRHHLGDGQSPLRVNLRGNLQIDRSRAADPRQRRAEDLASHFLGELLQAVAKSVAESLAESRT